MTTDLKLSDLDVKFKSYWAQIGGTQECADGAREFYLKCEVDAHMKKLKDAIEKAPRVYGQKNKFDVMEWGQYSDEQFEIEGPGFTDTHPAILLCIEPLKPKSVEVTESKLRDAYAKVFGITDTAATFEKFKKEFGL